MTRIRLEMMYELRQGSLLPWNQSRNDPKCNGALSIHDVRHKPSTKAEATTLLCPATSPQSVPSNSHTPSSVPSSSLSDHTAITKAEATNPSDDDIVRSSPQSSPSYSHTPSTVPLSSLSDHSPEPGIPQDQTVGKYGIHKCPLCDKEFKYYPSLHRHRKKVHSQYSGARAGTIKCHEQDCTFTCMYLSQLRSHLMSYHHITMATHEKTFQSYKEFEEWKTIHEKDTSSWFVKSTGSKVCDGDQITYFYCNRSGVYREEGKHKRRLKNQGSSKIGGYCTASIRVVHTTEGTIKAKICSTHYGHCCRIGHIRVPKEDRLSIAAQLSQGVSFDRVLDNIRDSVGKRFERIHLVTKKDLYNIERAFNFRGTQKHPIDAISVSSWVAEMMTKGEDSPVVLYKPQGTNLVEVGKCKGLGVHDLALVIQTPLQVDMLRNFGDNIVCVDATHGTNSYDFKLISIIVIDEFGEGCPVGWCISNREDQTLLSNFYTQIQQHVSANIQPKWFMSDDAGQYYTAWTLSFGGHPGKLLCTWHVDRAWRNAINNINNRDLRTSVYHTLRVLLEELDTKKFYMLLEKALIQWNETLETQSFYKYFATYYASRPQEWVLCYRKQSCINTNMYTEAFHRVLKYIYLKGTVNKRMDSCINALLKYARDKAFERVVKLEKGKATARIRTIMKRHQESLKLPPEDVKKTADGRWNVRSSKNPERTYTVTSEAQKCPFSCSLLCYNCGVCIHMYCCTCTDALVRGTICKHIHLVVSSEGKNKCAVTPEVSFSERAPTSDLILKSVQNKQRLGSLENLKDRLLSKLSNISVRIHELKDMDTLSAVSKHLDSCVGLLMLKTPPSEPSNKHIPHQRKFYSTVRKRKSRPRTRLAKPSDIEKQTITEELMKYGPARRLPQGLEKSTLYKFFSKCMNNDVILFARSAGQLILLCDINAVEVLAKNGTLISTKGILCSEDMQDSVIEVTLKEVERFFTMDAFQHLRQSVDVVRQDWQCAACKKSTVKLDMIACDHCDKWYHWICVGVQEEPLEWVCPSCKKKAKLTIVTSPH